MNPNITITPEEFETIERYILRQMPEDDYKVFTARLNNDEQLRNKLDSVRLLLLGVQEVSLANKMGDFHKGLMGAERRSSSTGKMASMRRWLVAASVVIVAGLSIFLFFGRATKEECLFTAYYKPDPGLISAMGASDNYLFDRSMIDYKLKKYDNALKGWESLLPTKPENDTLNYFIGSAYLAKDENDKAIAHFKKVTSQRNSYFLKETYWYMGLALIKKGETELAAGFIEKSQRENSEALLSELKK